MKRTLKGLNPRHSVEYWLILILFFNYLNTIYHLYSSIDAVKVDGYTHPDSVLFLNRISRLYAFPYSKIGHVDEPYWMQGSFVYGLFFKQNDFSSRYWHNPLVYGQPHVGRYIFGFAMDAVNGDEVDSPAGLLLWENESMNVFWTETRLDYAKEYNITVAPQLLYYYGYLQDSAEGGEVTPLTLEDFIICRKTVLLFSVLSVLLLTIYCYKLYPHLLAALVAGNLYMLNTLTLPTFQLVLVDPICCFFAILTLLLLTTLIENLDDGGKTLYLAIGTGCSLGLALSVKFTTVYILAVTVASSILTTFMGAVRPSGSKPKDITRRFTAVSIAFVCAWALFVLSNPFLYSDPLGNTYKMIDHRAKMMGLQSSIVQHSIDSIGQRLSLLYHKGVLLGYDLSLPFELVYVAILLQGILYLLKKSRHELTDYSVGRYTIAILWIACTYLVVGYGIHMDWDRYYMPFVMCSVTAFALGLGQTIDRTSILTQKIKAQYSPLPPSISRILCRERIPAD